MRKRKCMFASVAAVFAVFLLSLLSLPGLGRPAGVQAGTQALGEPESEEYEGTAPSSAESSSEIYYVAEYAEPEDLKQEDPETAAEENDAAQTTGSQATADLETALAQDSSQEVVAIDPDTGGHDYALTTDEFEQMRNAEHTDAIKLSDVTAELVTGGEYSFAECEDYDMTILFFWESFCPDCKEVLPELVKYCASKSFRINVVGIHMGWTDDADEAEFYMQTYGVNFPVVFANDELNNRIGYEVNIIPTFVFLDSSGHTVSDWIVMEEYEDFNAEITSALEVALDRAYN